MVEAARALKVGDGTAAGRDDGPGDQRERTGSASSATSRRASRKARSCSSTAARRASTDRPNGYFVGPTVFDEVSPEMAIGHEEIFGPVASICPVKTLDEAIALMKAHPNANATSIFTSSGKAAREFAKHATASMVGVNIGVAAPMAYFPFGGAKDSFFGDLKAHGRDAYRVLHRQEGHDLAVVLRTQMQLRSHEATKIHGSCMAAFARASSTLRVRGSR